MNNIFQERPVKSQASKKDNASSPIPSYSPSASANRSANGVRVLRKVPVHVERRERVERDAVNQLVNDFAPDRSDNLSMRAGAQEHCLQPAQSPHSHSSPCRQNPPTAEDALVAPGLVMRRADRASFSPPKRPQVANETGVEEVLLRGK